MAHRLGAILFACLVYCASSLHVRTKPCHDGEGEVSKLGFIDISPCQKDPCALKKGGSYRFSVAFTTGPVPKTIPAVTTHFYAVIDGVTIPWPHFNQTDTCRDSGIQCPLSANKPNTFSIELTVPNYFDIELEVEVRLEDVTTKKNLLCNLLEVAVVG